MQSLVKFISLLTIAFMVNCPASLMAGSMSPGPVAEQTQLETSALLASANRPAVLQAAREAQTHTRHKQVQTQSHTLSSLHTHTKTHPAAIILLVLAIAGVFLLPAMMERCMPSFVARFEVRV